MLTGSLASAVYGRPRATQDVDFVIEPDAARLRIFVESLPAGTTVLMLTSRSTRS